MSQRYQKHKSLFNSSSKAVLSIVCGHVNQVFGDQSVFLNTEVTTVFWGKVWGFAL